MQFEADEQLLQYHGRSMWPLFREGDLIVVRPVAWETLRVGDCIAFRSRGMEACIVHRIIGLEPIIRTQGDHVPHADDASVSPADIQGRAVACIRHGKRVPVAAGWWGRVTGTTLQWLARLDPSRDARLGRCARLLRTILSPLMSRWLTRAATIKFSNASGGSTERLVVAGRVVATLDDQDRVWQVDWPFNLWIVPGRLPTVLRPSSNESDAGCNAVSTGS